MKWLSEHEQAKHAIYNIVHELVFFVCAQFHIGGAETWVTRMTWQDYETTPREVCCPLHSWF